MSEEKVSNYCCPECGCIHIMKAKDVKENPYIPMKLNGQVKWIDVSEFWYCLSCKKLSITPFPYAIAKERGIV